MLALQMDVSSPYDRFCADKFVYALDHAGKISDKAKKAADILRDWDGRMSADSAAPTIETKARQELARLLLEPKLGPATEGASPGTLNWKSYRWSMSTVWMENILTKQPARWLPAGYNNYQILLATAVDNVLKQPEVPADVSQWKWGKVYPVEIEHPVLKHRPIDRPRSTSPEWKPVHSEGRRKRVWAVRAHNLELCRLRQEHAESRDRRKRNLFKRALHGPVASLVRRQNVYLRLLHRQSRETQATRDDARTATRTLALGTQQSAPKNNCHPERSEGPAFSANDKKAGASLRMTILLVTTFRS